MQHHEMQAVWGQEVLTDEVSHVGVVVLAGNVVQQAQLAEVQLLQGHRPSSV